MPPELYLLHCSLLPQYHPEYTKKGQYLAPADRESVRFCILPVLLRVVGKVKGLYLPFKDTLQCWWTETPTSALSVRKSA